MALKANESAVTQFEVVFKEIDAIYDLPFRRLVGSPNSPKVAINNVMRDPFLVNRYGQEKFVDETGESIDDPESDVPGMYQALRVSGYAPFWRSFSRKRSKELDKKYVYIWSADKPEGGGLKLEKELYFDKGELTFVDLVACAGKDKRPPGKKKAKSVWLDLVKTKGGKQYIPAYFAIVAPFPIPWARLEALSAGVTLPARAQRIADAFWTDGFTDGDPSKAKTFQELFKGKPPDTLGFLVHLVDPFKEALRRVEPYAKYVSDWRKKQESMASDAEYVLGKRVEAFAAGNKLEELVSTKLNPWLYDKEKDSFKLKLASDGFAENLLRWVAYGHQLDRMGPSDICYRESGKQYQPDKAQPHSSEWFNPFTEAVRDYLEGDEDAFKTVSSIALLVQSRLAESEVGVAWMKAAFGELVDKAFPVGTAGAEILFEARRKTATTFAEGWTGFFKLWAPFWIEKYGTPGTKNIQTWLKQTHSKDVALLSPGKLKRKTRALEKARLRNEELWLESTPGSRGELGSKAFDHFMLGLETYNLAMAAWKFYKERERWNGLALIGAMGDFYGAASKISSRLEELEVPFKYAGATKMLKVTPWVAVMSSVIDIVTGVHDISEAKTTGKVVGHGLRTVGAVATLLATGGSALEIGGASTSEAGWGIPVFVVGIFLEASGSWMVSNLSAAAVFLRNCKWGSGEGLVDKISDTNELGYTGKMRDFGKDVPAQLKAIDELVYGFAPKLELVDEKSVIISKSVILRTGTPERDNPFSSKCKWTIEAEIDHRDGTAPEKWSFKPDALTTDEEASMNEPLVVKAFTKRGLEKDPHKIDHGKISIKGVAKVDLHGDGKHVVEREFDNDFTLSWF